MPEALRPAAAAALEGQEYLPHRLLSRNGTGAEANQEGGFAVASINAQLDSRVASLFGEAMMRQPKLPVKPGERSNSARGSARTSKQPLIYLIGAQWWKAAFLGHFLDELEVADQALPWTERARLDARLAAQRAWRG